MNKETSQTYPTTQISSRDPFRSFNRHCDNFSSFEETFDTNFLRKFFREHDLAHSQTTCSPQKENLVIEKAHSSTTAECESQSSPHEQCGKPNNNIISPDKNPRADLSLNFNLNPKVFEIKRLVNDRHLQLVMRKGSMIVTNNDQMSQPDTEIKIEQGKENARIERLLKNKKVFRVIKDQRPAQMTHILNMKRVASTPIEEENLVPRLKQTKSQPKSQSFSETTSEYFTFNIPVDFNNKKSQNHFNFSSHLPLFQAQNITPQQNIYSFQSENQGLGSGFFPKY